MFHLNIKSLPKHHDELEMHLDSLKFPFFFIGFTETWLDEYKENLYDIPQYVFVTRYRKTKRVVVSHYSFVIIFHLSQEMTWPTLIVKWRLCLLKLTRVYFSLALT